MLLASGLGLVPAVSAGPPREPAAAPAPPAPREPLSPPAPARPSTLTARVPLADLVGEWRCDIQYGRNGPRRRLRMILEADGSWLVQGEGRQAGYLVLGTWFQAPAGDIFGSGRIQRFGSAARGLGPLFAMQLWLEAGRLVSAEDPRASCHRP